MTSTSTATKRRWLVDTNLLLRIADRNDLDYGIALAALKKIGDSGEERCITTQNVIEFWGVATRPTTARGGLGLSLVRAALFVRMFRRIFTLLPETPNIPEEWEDLPSDLAEQHDHYIYGSPMVREFPIPVPLRCDLSAYEGVTGFEGGEVVAAGGHTLS